MDRVEMGESTTSRGKCMEDGMEDGREDDMEVCKSTGSKESNMEVGTGTCFHGSKDNFLDGGKDMEEQKGIILLQADG
jgi:hypothetical protein